MQEDLSSRIETLLQRVFEVQPRDLKDTTHRGDLERWDSLGHLRMVAALREGLKVELTPDQALDMETVADVKRIVRSALTGATAH